MKKLLSVLIFLMLMQPKLFAVQDVKKVYLNQAIDAALENNIDLQAAKLERNIAKNNIKTCLLYTSDAADE